MLEPTTVWLWRPGDDPAGTKGTLALAEGATLLRFAAAGAGVLEIPARELRRVRRTRLSPVVEVTYERRAESRVALFYFAPPPPLLAGASMLPSLRKHREQRAGAQYLAWSNATLKERVRAWARAIEEARRR